jgi:hypothetical protein
VENRGLYQKLNIEQSDIIFRIIRGHGARELNERRYNPKRVLHYKTTKIDRSFNEGMGGKYEIITGHMA